MLLNWNIVKVSFPPKSILDLTWSRLSSSQYFLNWNFIESCFEKELAKQGKIFFSKDYWRGYLPTQRENLITSNNISTIKYTFLSIKLAGVPPTLTLSGLNYPVQGSMWWKDHSHSRWEIASNFMSCNLVMWTGTINMFIPFGLVIQFLVIYS